MTVIIICLFGVLILLRIFSSVLLKREVKSMTLEKFKKRCDSYVADKDGKGLVSFVTRNFVFVLKHKAEVKEILRAYSDSSDVKNNLEV